MAGAAEGRRRRLETSIGVAGCAFWTQLATEVMAEWPRMPRGGRHERRPRAASTVAHR
jgi:hypothetical protein